MSDRDIRIRAEAPGDRATVRAVNEMAFGAPAEADLVDSLRERRRVLVSLVAELDSIVIGHVLFSPVVADEHPRLALAGLGPLAVRPECQRRGVGTLLVREGLARCAALDCAGVVVVGHAAYYPRFGFVPGSRYGLKSEYDVPDDVFMALELKPLALADAAGLVRYDGAFAHV